jgi:hypothetical protein
MDAVIKGLSDGCLRAGIALLVNLRKQPPDWGEVLQACGVGGDAGTSAASNARAYRSITARTSGSLGSVTSPTSPTSARAARARCSVTRPSGNGCSQGMSIAGSAVPQDRRSIQPGVPTRGCGRTGPGPSTRAASSSAPDPRPRGSSPASGSSRPPVHPGWTRTPRAHLGVPGVVHADRRTSCRWSTASSPPCPVRSCTRLGSLRVERSRLQSPTRFKTGSRYNEATAWAHHQRVESNTAA